MFITQAMLAAAQIAVGREVDEDRVRATIKAAQDNAAFLRMRGYKQTSKASMRKCLAAILVIAQDHKVRVEALLRDADDIRILLALDSGLWEK